ncbi:MAG: hypothetical protein WCK76_10070, partial [Elusimicrobiota bacterium]
PRPAGPAPNMPTVLPFAFASWKLASPSLLARSMTAAWTAAVRSAGETAAVKSARTSAQHYTNADNKDMSHFVQLASEGAQNAGVRQQGKALSDFIAGELVLVMGRVGGVGPATRGLTVYLPEGSFFDNDYDSLVWGKVSGWGSFARWAQAIR